MRKIILASSSPRRKALLEQLIGNNFEIITSNYEEDNNLDMSPIELAKFHSFNKGKNVASKINSGIVISCDTFVTFRGKVLGKPHSPEIARQTLMTISGKFVEGISGLAIIDLQNDKTIQDYEITKIKIKNLSENEINHYISSGEPLDKAGAFGIQEKGSIFIEKIDGCYLNVVGLPIFKLNQMLNKLGINIFDYK